MKFDAFKNLVVMEYRKNFHSSLCDVSVYKGFGKTIWVKCYLAANTHEEINGYYDNDMFNIGFKIELPEAFNVDTDEMPDKISVEVVGKSFHVLPENKYMCYGVHVIPMRKCSGSAEKIIRMLGRNFEALKSAVIDELHGGRIHDNYIRLTKEKIA